MSGFSADWLALREPADHASVNLQVRDACANAFAGRDSLQIVDLGSGTGSNLRNLSRVFGPRQHWTLVDYDTRLLDVARSRQSEAAAEAVAYRQADLSAGDFASVIGGADLVTASALFDLVSPAIIERLAADVSAAGATFYTVLTYDGVASWMPKHPVDTEMRDAFNLHQHSDKGFGPAAGPNATERLAAAFERRGYRVQRGKSPWFLDESFTALRHEVDRGWAGAAAEAGVNQSICDAWLKHRLTAKDAVTIVGHEDLLALPPSR